MAHNNCQQRLCCFLSAYLAVMEKIALVDYPLIAEKYSEIDLAVVSFLFYSMKAWTQQLSGISQFEMCPFPAAL